MCVQRGTGASHKIIKSHLVQAAHSFSQKKHSQETHPSMMLKSSAFQIRSQLLDWIANSMRTESNKPVRCLLGGGCQNTSIMFQKSSQTRTLGGHVNIMLVQSPVRLVSLHMRIALIKPSATDLGTKMSDPTFGARPKKNFYQPWSPANYSHIASQQVLRRACHPAQTLEHKVRF